MAAFKDEYSPQLVAALGHELQIAWAQFPMDRWQQTATDGLDELELLQRVDHLARALGACLPTRFDEAAAILFRLLDHDEFDGWMMLPVGYYVADAGIDEPDIALPLLAALTPRFSSEGPIRPFIERHPVTTYRYLRRWTQDPDEHVRRLVSEGTRPRLPWAPQLRGLIADPSPAIELLDRLYDDESEYVRRSVANHLNDISKDHPELAIECARRWQAGSTRGDYVVRHGLRSLIKKGDPSALALLGFEYDNEVQLVRLEIRPTRIDIGDEILLEAELTAPTATKAVIDYVVHYQGAKGVKAGKVFKLTTRTIGPDEATRITKRHRFEHVSIRRIHQGPHLVEIQVNGRVLGGVTVEITGRAK